ncbi:ATP-binding protein [Vibrio cyclitrophicus]|uniref:ATP-binding protein n=2 Tax=Vibrio cyclitrophicus TaxID=47951 RepID=UPI000303CE2E|nr:ATP-binding protein [Vibrio cyclitrophicus]
MKFHVIERSERIPLTAQTAVYLRKDNWNDFSFKTLFRLEVVEKQKKIDIGLVKIAFRGQTTTTPTYHKLEDTFTELTNDFFSLGESVDYYQNLNNLTLQTKTNILKTLNDIANNPDAINQVRDEEVLKTSLLRDHSLTTVKGEFSRTILDQPRLTNFKFTFERTESEEMGGIKLNFNVDKKTSPPSNIHALIGRNGSGKTTILNGIISTITDTDSESNCTLYERVRREKTPISQDYFSSLVSVSFSAFDPFTPPKDQPNPSKGTCYFYIGLQDPDNENRLRSIDDLRHDFVKSLVNCFRKRGKRRLWKDTISKLNSDENFEQMNLISMHSDYVDLRKKTEGQVDSKTFRATLLDKVLPKLNSLSSGHSIVLFTLTQLVAKTEEKTLVLIDEPEGHLHPPLYLHF